ncbi:MAG: hypothetical protein HC840_01225 [Leptolyngbyaceae cyanobacterium RM2_2_4]|nr:hypothetical protein [Leptolyngbyaceae cyanobacterium RM2_2_4]
MVEINKVNTFADLALLLDRVLDAEMEYAKKYPTGLSKLSTVEHIIRVFSLDKSYCWGELYPDGELKFFALVELKKDNTCFWHVLHSHPRFRYRTKDIVNQIFTWLKSKGVLEVYSATRRVTPSYKRWMASLGCYPIEITYKRKL